MYPRKIGKFIPLVVTALVIACGGVGSGGEGSESSSSTKSLRLGQTDSTNSPVAVSAAIDNLESLVVLNSGTGASDISHVLYRASTNQVVRITVGENGRPISAATEDGEATFANFTETTVDVTIIANGQVLTTVTSPLDDETVNLLKRLSLPRGAKVGGNANAPILRELLRSTLVAVRTFGCASEFASSSANVGAVFGAIAGATCRSQLLDTIKDVVDDNDDEIIERVVQGLPEESTCDFNSDGWINDFDNAERCAGVVGETLVQEVLRETPLPSVVVNQQEDPRLDPLETGNPLVDVPNQQDPNFVNPRLPGQDATQLPPGVTANPTPQPSASSSPRPSPSSSPNPGPNPSPSPSPEQEPDVSIPDPKPPDDLADPPTPPLPEDPVAENN